MEIPAAAALFSKRRVCSNKKLFIFDSHNLYFGLQINPPFLFRSRLNLRNQLQNLLRTRSSIVHDEVSVDLGNACSSNAALRIRARAVRSSTGAQLVAVAVASSVTRRTLLRLSLLTVCIVSRTFGKHPR